MKITDTLEGLLRLLVTTDDDGHVKDRNSQERPLPDWVKRVNEQGKAHVTPPSPPEPPPVPIVPIVPVEPMVQSVPIVPVEPTVEVFAPVAEVAEEVERVDVPERVVEQHDLEKHEHVEDDGVEPSVPGLLDSLITWVQSASEESKPVAAAEEPAPAEEPFVVEPVGFEPVAAEPVVIEPLGLEPEVPRLGPEPERDAVTAFDFADEPVPGPEPAFERVFEPESVFAERIPVPPRPVSFAPPVDVSEPAPVGSPEVEDVDDVEAAKSPGEELVPVADDFTHLETAARVAETLNLGFHLGSAVERIASASTQGSEGVLALREAAWLIERYVAILEKRPIGADLHLTAAKLARQGDAIAGLKALAEALDAESAAAPESNGEPPVDVVAEVVSPPEPDILGVGRIRRLSPEPPP